MKAVMISIRPEWCEKIASGKKTIEVRKTKPKLETPFKCYVYCSKARNEALWRYQGEYFYDTQFPKERPNKANGKVIGEFVCNFMHVFPWRQNEFPFQDSGEYIISSNELKESCLTYSDFENYGVDGMEFRTLYGWHISELKIYDKPKNISEFMKPCIHGDKDISCFLCDRSGYRQDMNIDCFNYCYKPPQSWCYVEENTDE